MDNNTNGNQEEIPNSSVLGEGQYSSLPGSDTPYGSPAGNDNLYGSPAGNGNPYGSPAGNDNLYGSPAGNGNPYGSPAGNNNPYGSPAGNDNPYGSPAGNGSPYGSPAGNDNPYGSPYSNPYGEISYNNETVNGTYNNGGAYHNNGTYGNNGYNGGSGYQGYQPELEEPVKMSEWLLLLCLITFIPCVGIILAIVWAFSKEEKKSKINYCKAYLVMLLIQLVVGVIGLVAFSGIFIGLLGY